MAFKGAGISRVLTQTAVYWAPPTKDAHAKGTFTTGTEMSVRWEEKQEIFVNAQGEEVRSAAVVILGSDVVKGGYLYLGTLSSLGSDARSDPTKESTAHEIRAFSKVPNLAGTSFGRKAWL